MKKLISLIAAAAILMACVASFPMTSLAAGKGDVNKDGKVNTADVRELLMIVATEKTPTEQQMYWGDYNINNTLDTTDARTLLDITLRAESNKAPVYATPTGSDCWGERSIAVLGDSISFGAGVTDSIAESSYVGLVKKAVAAANGGNMNYGFTSAYPSLWTSPRTDEIHAWPERTSTNGKTDWICDYDETTGLGGEDGHRLVSVAMTSITRWSMLTYELQDEYKDDYNYFCVYYQARPDAGNFAIADGNQGEVPDINGSKAYINAAANTTSTTNETRRTAFYRLSDCPDGKIRICAGSATDADHPITITGIGYYKDLNEETITFNNYSRGGLSLQRVKDVVLDQVASADTLIFALGYNDIHFYLDKVQDGTFSERIDYLIKKCNENGTNVIVNDDVWFNEYMYKNTNKWDDARIESFRVWHTFLKDELKRLARETNGIYIDQQNEIGSDKILAELNSSGADGVHPPKAGHAMMAENIIEALGLK